MNLREVFFKDINYALNESAQFSATDFKIINRESKTESTIAVIEIQYNYKPDYIFKIFVPKSKTSYRVKNDYDNSYSDRHDYQFTIESCPGEFIMTEKSSVISKKSLLKEIGNWLGRIWEELQALPINREIENIKSQVESLHKKFDDIPEDAYFNEEESEDFRAKLDALHQKIEEQIKKQNISEEELHKKISTLNDEIKTLKQTIEIFGKKNWFKSFSTKVIKWVSDPNNRKLLKDGSEIVKGFLPEDIKGQ